MNIEYGNKISNFLKGEVSHLNVLESLKLGYALGKSLENGRVGIGYCSDESSKSNAMALMAGLSATNINVWNFGEVFLSKLSFLILFSCLSAGVFIDSKRGSIILIGSDGKSVPYKLQNKINANLNLIPESSETYSNIFDMSPLNGIYLKELKNGFDCNSCARCTIKSSNIQIENLLRDAVNQKDNPDFVLRVNKFGTGVSAYTKQTGLIPFNKLVLICENYENSNRKENTDFKLYKKELWKNDALFLSVKILSIIEKEKTDIISLFNSLPACYIKRKVVNLEIPKDFCEKLKINGFNVNLDNENIIRLKANRGIAAVLPLISGKTGVFTQCESAESAQELTSKIENIMQNQNF